MMDLVHSPFTSGNLSSDLIGIAGAEQSLVVSLLLLVKLLSKPITLSTIGSFKYKRVESWKAGIL